MGDAYSSLERYADAEKYLDEGLRLAARSGRKPVQVLALCSLGELWNKQRRHESALSPLREATDLATGSGARPAMMRCHLALYKANKSLGEFEPALLHCEHHHALKSQLYSEQMSTRLRNLEDRHRTDAAIKEAKMVQDQVTELEHLNYAISHDLKGPLLTIRAFADLLAQDLAANDRTKVSGDLNWIRSAAATMQKRVSELLKLSQVRPGRYSFVTVDVNELIDEVINSLGGPISERGSLIQGQTRPSGSSRRSGNPGARFSEPGRERHEVLPAWLGTAYRGGRAQRTRRHGLLRHRRRHRHRVEISRIRIPTFRTTKSRYRGLRGGVGSGQKNH